MLLPASVTCVEARDTHRLLIQAMQGDRSGAVMIDASNLKIFDSSALAVLMDCQRLAKAFGREFTVRSAPHQLAALAKLYGVNELLQLS